MKAKDVMTVEVISVEPDASIMQAVRLMLQNRISGLPVIDAKGQLKGILTEGDLLRRGELGTQRHRSRWIEFLIGPGQLASEYVQACGRKVREVMSTDVQVATEDMPLQELVGIMERHRIKRMPVLRDGKVVGIVSRANLLHALASLARDSKTDLRDDEIREHILSKLRETSWAPLSLVNIIVRDGIVQLWGAILDGRQRDALLVVAENAPGVRLVEDHLVWIEPHSGMAVVPSEVTEQVTVVPAR
jgi:CBS domain-containing protein